MNMNITNKNITPIMIPIMIDEFKETIRNYDTNTCVGFSQLEIDELLVLANELNIKVNNKILNENLLFITCSMDKDNNVVFYKNDVFNAFSKAIIY